MRCAPRRRGHSVIAALLVALIGLTSVGACARVGEDKITSIKASNEKEGRAMNEASEQTARALKLPDAIYYASSDEPFERVAAALAPPDTPARPAAPSAPGLGLEPVFALGTPSAVAPERGADLFAVIVLRYSGARPWEARLAVNLHVLVVDLRTGALKWVNPLLLDDPEIDPSRSGPPPSDVTRRASLHGSTRFHIPALFGEKWPSPLYAVTAIYYDWVSNTVTVAGRPPEGLGPAPTRSPSPFLEPAPPVETTAPGLKLKLPAARGPGGSIPVSGTVTAAIDAIALAPISGKPDRSAMVATLVLVALDNDHPRTIELVVPVEVRGETAVGSFALDLAARPEIAGLAGELQAFLVSGRTVSAAGVLTIAPR